MKYLLLLFLIFVIFYYININLNINEHMSMKDPYFNKFFKDSGYKIDTDNYSINKCENDKCIEIKKYSTKYFNNNESHYLAKNKDQSNKIFLENNIPVPKHWIINKENKNYYLNEFNIFFPCVLKPIDGMQGKDVNTFIKNKIQYSKILNNLLNKYDKIMLENQVDGDNYRIFVFNDKVIDVIKREKPFIIGDGINDISSLIEIKNNNQRKKKLFPTKNIDYEYILEQGFNKDDIPDNNKIIFITNTINFHNGANPVRIKLEDIPEININMFIKAHKLIGLECSGVDYMSDDIKLPYNSEDGKGHIIEINDMVDTKIHIDSDNKSKPFFLYENILKSIQ